MPPMFDATKPLPIPEIGDTIIRTQAHAVPFQRLVKRGKMPKQMLATWPVELYEDRGYEGTLDGADQTDFDSFTRFPVRSYGMLLRTKGVAVSKLAQLTVDAGVPRKKEMAKQILEDGKSLARMIESALLSTLDHRPEVGAVPYRVRGAFSWLNDEEQGELPVPAQFRPPEAATYRGPLADFTDSIFEEMLRAMATQKGETVNLKGFVGLNLKRAMSLWGQRQPLDSGEGLLASTNINASEKRLLQVVDRFEFDSGVVYTVPSFYLARAEATGAPSAYTPRSGIFIDPAMWEVAYLQDPSFFTNPDLGGGPRGYHDAVFMAKCLNPQGQGFVLTAEDVPGS